MYCLLVAVRDGLDSRLVSSNSTGGNTGSFNPPTFDTDSGLPRQKLYLDHTDNRGDEWLAEDMQTRLTVAHWREGDVAKIHASPER